MRTLCALLLVLPISMTFSPGPETSDGEWLYDFTLNSFEYSIVLIPLIIAFVAIPFLQNLKKKVLILLSIVLASFCSFYAYQFMTIPIQDFIPQIGTIVLLILFPFSVVNAFKEW